MNSISNNYKLRQGDSVLITDGKKEDIYTVTKDKFSSTNVWGLQNKTHHFFEIEESKNENHTKATFKDVKRVTKLQGGLILDAKLKEKTLRNKYPDWPFKRIKTLTNSGNRRQNANYEIVQGTVLDSDLANELGTDNVYYQKALQNFTIDFPRFNESVHISKGTVGGALVLDSKRSNFQLSELKDNANWRHNHKDQNLWIDENSYLKGNWYLPQHTVLQNTKVDIKSTNLTGQNRGFSGNQNLFKNSAIKGSGSAIFLLNYIKDSNLQAPFVSTANNLDKVNSKANVSLSSCALKKCQLKADTKLTNVCANNKVLPIQEKTQQWTL